MNKRNAEGFSGIAGEKASGFFRESPGATETDPFGAPGAAENPDFRARMDQPFAAARAAWVRRVISAQFPAATSALSTIHEPPMAATMGSFR